MCRYLVKIKRPPNFYSLILPQFSLKETKTKKCREFYNLSIFVKTSFCVDGKDILQSIAELCYPSEICVKFISKKET